MSGQAAAGEDSSARAPIPIADERWDELRRHLARAVRRVCPRWLACQSDDIVQAAFLRVLDLLRKTEGTAELGSSYLWKVAYTATVDEIRRARRRREVSLDGGLVEHPARGSTADPEQVRAGSEIGQKLQECLQAMLATRRAAVTLYLQGHAVPEVARLLDWKAKKVENLVFRGLADLRRCLSCSGLTP